MAYQFKREPLTRGQAITALRRFVEQSLAGELKITDVAQRLGADSAHMSARSKPAGTA
jgi:hypothetical protein